MCSLFFLPDRPTHLHERMGDGKRNILLGWPKRKSSCHFAWRNSSIAVWMFAHPTEYGSDTWKAFLLIKNYFYQHQNITIIIKGESETCPNFWNRHTNSLPKVYRFIWSCRVFFYYWTFFSPLSRFSLHSSSRSLCYLPHFARTASRKKRAAKTILFA